MTERDTQFGRGSGKKPDITKGSGPSRIDSDSADPQKRERRSKVNKKEAKEKRRRDKERKKDQ